MDQLRRAGAAMALLITAVTLLTGCGPTRHSPGRDAATTAGLITSPPASRNSPGTSTSIPSHGGRGGNRSSAAAASLPADWPPDVPVPPGTISGSTGSTGRWTVLLVAGGSAAEVRRSTLAFYTAAGFTAVSDSVLNKGSRQITLVVENRDHSATQTNLVIQVSTI
jgi:hypothetical protein